MTNQQLTPEQDLAGWQGGYDALMDYPRLIEDEPGVKAKGKERGYDGDKLDAYVGGYLEAVAYSRADPRMVDVVHHFLRGINDEEASIRLLRAGQRLYKRKMQS